MMGPMRRRLPPPDTSWAWPRGAVALTAAAVLGLAGCGGSEAEPAAEAASTTAPASTPATAPPTTAPPTTAPVTTTTPAATTTTVAPTTTFPTITTSPPATTTTSTTTTLVVDLPDEPTAPPTDVHASEPMIEVGSIVIPKLEVDMTMFEGIRLSTLEHGPGHWPGTAMPGEVGNVVVGGHRTSSHRVFRNVDQLVAGDEIIFRDDDGEHTYHVDRVEIVDPSAIWIVDQTDTATATLFACHPPGSTAQRIVVFADLADSHQG
jgi:sortase A